MLFEYSEVVATTEVAVAVEVSTAFLNHSGIQILLWQSFSCSCSEIFVKILQVTLAHM